MDTRAPGSSVSAPIRPFSSADQRRRRPGQYLDPPETTLRVVINLVHNDSSKPSASSNIIMFVQTAEDGPSSIAYVCSKSR